jgi:NAD(P)-dependent dehydrogenase (short-subunit alcohol dehydrogenase family)
MSGKRVLITGTASGIGRAATTAFLERGWHVLAGLRDAEARATLFAEDEARFGDRLELLELDVTREWDRRRARARVEALGGLDCLINNAGYGLFGALENLEEAQLRAQFEVNCFGAIFLTQALLPALRRRRGTLLNVSSVFGALGFPLAGGYCGSKFALEGFTEALRLELAPHGVRVGLVEPGNHRTRFGENLAWGARDEPAYAAQNAAYQRFRQRLRARPAAASPEPVVRALVRLAQARRVPLRTRVGRDVRSVALLRALLPEDVFVSLYGTMTQRMMRGSRRSAEGAAELAEER